MSDSSNCGCGDPAPVAEIHIRIETAPEPQVLDSVATCNDGALSGAGGKSGACSWHGGVSK